MTTPTLSSSYQLSQADLDRLHQRIRADLELECARTRTEVLRESVVQLYYIAAIQVVLAVLVLLVLAAD